MGKIFREIKEKGKEGKRIRVEEEKKGIFCREEFQCKRDKWKGRGSRLGK